MRTNIAPLNEAFCEFGTFADQSKMCATVSSNLYVMLLEHHLLSSRPSLNQMRKELPEYLSEEGFRKALCSGAELDPEKERLVGNADRGKFIGIWIKYARKRCKSKAKRFAKRLLRK
jgi:hypothetical protein